MLITKHHIEIEVDNIKFALTFDESVKKVREKQESFEKEHGDVSSQQEKLRNELHTVLSEMQLNDQLLNKGEELNKSDITTLCREQKDLFKEKKRILAELKPLNEKAKEIIPLQESFAKETFAMRIGGKDIDALMKYIDENGLSYEKVFLYIHQEVQKAIEKK